MVAGLAGISSSHLHRIETGERALDSVKQIVALATALGVAPSELFRLPVPAPANGGTDGVIEAVRVALMAASHDLPGGQVQPVEQLRARVTATVDGLCRCESERAVGAALPALIADLHTSIAARRDGAELLDLAVLLHTQGTIAWLRLMGAPVDLCTIATVLSRRAAQDRDAPAALALAATSGARVMIMAGAFDLAKAQLDSVTVPTTTTEEMQLAGFCALRQSVVAAADSRQGDADAALEFATELADRTGEGNAYQLAFGPTNVGLFRMSGMLEVGDHAGALNIAENLRPVLHADESRTAYYWKDYGRAAARVRGRQNDAVIAFRRAEMISPHHVLRDPFARDVLAELLARAQRDAIGRELRGMAYRAGLPV